MKKRRLESVIKMNEPTKFCRTCGTSNRADAVFCRSCGTRFSEFALNKPPSPPAYAATQRMPPRPQRRTSRKQYVIAGVAVLAVILIIAAAASWSSPSSPFSPSSPAATSLSIESKEISVSIPLDNSSTVSATLSTSAESNQLGGKTIQWFVNDQPAGNSTTDESGEALLPLQSVTPSIALGTNYTVRAEFDGDSAYLQSNDTSTLTPYMETSDYSSMVYNQTVGLVQSGSFPSISNATHFAGTYLAFDLSQNDTTRYPYLNSLPVTVYNPSSTVFLVKTTQLDYVGQYYSNLTNAAGGKGYRAQFDIYVIKYPEKTPIGKYSITSEPPTVTGYSLLDQIGSPSDWQTWISQHTDVSS